MRHVPVEDPYEEVLRIVPQAGEEDCLAQFQIATDGSARSSVGAFSAVLLAPYAAIETAVVGRGRMTGAATNIILLRCRLPFRVCEWLLKLAGSRALGPSFC